jgi:hypothetical protein
MKNRWGLHLISKNTWKTTQKRHDFGDTSATSLFLTPEQRQRLAQSPGGQKFGIDGLDEPAGIKEKDSRTEANPHHMPSVTENKVCAVAEKLGHDKHRWTPAAAPQGPKCNLYVDAVMHDSGMPRPWSDKGVPLCIDMQQQLSRDSRYSEVWSTDYKDYGLSYQLWAKFDLRPGDVCLWNTNLVTHGAIAVDNKYFDYAGAREGFKRVATDFVTGTDTAPTNYGPPTKVFRYNGMVPER